MGICLSRRAMQADAAAEAEADSAGASSKFRNRHGKASGTGNEADMINPTRLLLESPRISTNEMGMLGMFFQKKYCKPLQQQQQHGYEKLTPKKAECELGLEPEMASSKGSTMMTANVLFEKDEYPTFEPNARAAAAQAAESVVPVAVAAGRVENEEEARRSKDSNAVNEGGGGCSRGDQMWASAGEDFFSDWEDRSDRGSSGIRGSTAVASGAPEIGVFEAEQYFKEEQRASDGSCFYDASNNNNNDEESSSSTSEALLKQPAEASRSLELKRPAKSPSGSGGSGVGSSSGIRWSSSCAATSAVQIDGGEAFLDHGRTLRRAKSKAELQLSKMFKLLGSSSSSSHKPRNSMATTTTTTSRTTGKRQQQQQQQHKSNENTKPSKSSKIRESHVKDWMDKARKSSDGIFALGQEDQQRCDSNNEQQPQHADLNLLPDNAAAHHQPVTPEHSATGGQPVGFTFSGSTTDSSAAGTLIESATSTHNQGFGSPFPASPNSDQKQQPEEPRIIVSACSSSRDRLPARPRPRPRAKTRSIIQHEEGDVGNESDSSSDLFELDSVTTSLSSARSSLSRLSSARSSIRKSTADEQDLLHLQFCCDNKAVLAATLRANVLESNPASAARAALACNVGAAEDAAPAENASSATKNQDFLRERVASNSQSIIGGSAAAGGITANEENKPPPPTSNRRAKSEILLSSLGSSRLSLNARSVAPWNNSNGVLAVQT